MSIITNDEIAAMIFSYMDITLKDVASLSLVCRNYRKFFDCEELWSFFWMKKYPLQHGAVNNYKFSYKQMELYEKSFPKVNQNLPSEVKVCLIGGGGAGKSCLVIRFITSLYTENFEPTIDDAYRKNVHHERGEDHIDTSGNEDYPSLKDICFRSSDYILLCYDCRSKPSFNDAKMYFNYYKHYEKHTILVECKRDANFEEGVSDVSQNEAKDYAKQHKMPFVSTSAKDNINTSSPFEFIANHKRTAIDLKIIEKLNKGECIIHNKQNKRNQCITS
ncbi:Ras-related protein Rap [Acrasis kona]|uniref:Ras-related protein Rap n=1 Tax=Acrasis kona TaxID=1008807 RepID=A0AAW2Z5F3_9EUKA